MKKLCTLLLVMAMTVCMLAGCDGKSDNKDEPLRVAVQSYYCSAMVEYIQANKLAENAGLDIEWIVFNGGAPINEAMGEWDIAVTGGAFVYALANYDCKLIAHQVNGTGGNYICVRKDDPLLNAKTPEEIADCVRGKTLLSCFGTTGHYTLSLWLESIGVDPSECNMMNLEIANVYSSWVAGEGDIAVLTEPYCYYDMDAMNTTIYATLESIGGELYESTVCTSKAYQNRYDDVVKFTELLYTACDALAADQELAVQTVIDWYTSCGKTLSEEEARQAVEAKPFISSEEAGNITLGQFAKSYAGWFASRELIDATGLKNVEENIATDVFSDALKNLKK